jgi:hypothetical protein
VNKNRLITINRLKTRLELYGYNNTRIYIENFYNELYKYSCCLYDSDENVVKIESAKYYEFGILDILYNKEIKFNLYKRLKFEIKNRIIKLIMKSNIKKLEKDKKESLSDFLKSIRNKELKNRNIRW